MSAPTTSIARGSVIRAWRRLALLTLCALLLGAQQQSRLHALSHGSETQAAHADAHRHALEHAPAHEAATCALCLAAAATAGVMPTAGIAMAWAPRCRRVAVVSPTVDGRGPVAPTHPIRGPPAGPGFA